MDDPIIVQSPLKYGLTEDEILYAYSNPLRAWDLEDAFTTLIGAKWTAIILKIGWVQGSAAVVIVHAMRARDMFLRR